MKRLIPLLLVILLLFGGCVTEDTVHEPFETVAGGQNVVVQYDVGSTGDGIVTAENGDVYYFKEVSGEGSLSRTYWLTYPDGCADAVYSHRSNTTVSPASKYIRTEELLDAILLARPLHLPDVWLMLALSALLILAGVGAFFIPRGVIAMFSAPKGLTPLATKQLVRMEPSDRKTGSIFYKIVGAVVAACGVALLIATLT